MHQFLLQQAEPGLTLLHQLLSPEEPFCSHHWAKENETKAEMPVLHSG